MSCRALQDRHAHALLLDRAHERQPPRAGPGRTLQRPRPSGHGHRSQRRQGGPARGAPAGACRAAGQGAGRVRPGRAEPALLLRRRHLSGAPQPQSQGHRRAGRPDLQHRRAHGVRGAGPPAPARAVRSQPGLDGPAPRQVPAGGHLPRQLGTAHAVLAHAAHLRALLRLVRRRHRHLAGGSRHGGTHVSGRLPHRPRRRRPRALPPRRRPSARAAAPAVRGRRVAAQRVWACCCGRCAIWRTTCRRSRSTSAAPTRRSSASPGSCRRRSPAG